jgi:polyphenol oxidase
MRTPFEVRHQGAWSYICLPRLETSGIFHGFVTKPLHASVEEEGIEDAISAFSFETYVLLNQEHGDAVHVIKNGERPRVGDGLLLLERNVAGIIKTADCLPVILYSTSMPVVAIVHAGWRGTALRIAGKAVRQMAANGGKPENIGALIGPGIGPCCYEVQGDVAQVFRAAGFGDQVIERGKDSLFLDLKAVNIRMLQHEGVKEIYDVGLCTACRKDLFYSARRDKAPGRQINFVLMRG